MHNDLLCRIQSQINQCYKLYGSYSSSHEAYGVLIEEVQELFEEIRKIKPNNFNCENIEKEIIDCLTVLLKMYQDIVVEKVGRQRVKKESRENG